MQCVFPTYGQRSSTHLDSSQVNKLEGKKSRFHKYVLPAKFLRVLHDVLGDCPKQDKLVRPASSVNLFKRRKSNLAVIVSSDIINHDNPWLLNSVIIFIETRMALISTTAVSPLSAYPRLCWQTLRTPAHQPNKFRHFLCAYAAGLQGKFHPATSALLLDYVHRLF